MSDLFINALSESEIGIVQELVLFYLLAGAG
jgi:hypothetical protein